MASSLDTYSDTMCAQRKANGDPCQSPALRGERICHYHKVMGMPKVDIESGEDAGPNSFGHCRS